MEDETARQASTYVNYMLPSVFLYVQFDCIKQFLFGFGKATIPMLVQILTSVLHYFWCQLFIVTLKYELIGVAYANIITQITNMVLIIIFVST
jgi:Na+-driven multidrug efflux pump